MRKQDMSENVKNHNLPEDIICFMSLELKDKT